MGQSQFNNAMKTNGGGAAGLLATPKKYDKDRTGTLSGDEFKRLVRVQLKITPEKLSDANIKHLVDALDDDGSNTLALDEIYDFIERGTATLYAGEALGGDEPSPASKNKHAPAMSKESVEPKTPGQADEGGHEYHP